MNRFLIGSCLVVTAGLFLAGCPKPPPPVVPNTTVLVTFLQADSSTPWGKMYDKQMAEGAKKHIGDFKFSEEDAGGDAKKQISQIQDAVKKKPRFLLVSPVSDDVIPELAKAHDAGIFVFLLDRWQKNNPADAYVGTNNTVIGADMGIFYGRQLHLKGTVLVIPGPASSVAAGERVKGMLMELKGFKVASAMADDCGGSESKAKDYVANYIKSKKPLDGIFAANDEMALGAAEAVKEAKANVSYIFGVGGDEQKVFDALKDGDIYATFSDPPGGPTALDMIPDILNKINPPKATNLTSNEIRKDTMDSYLKDNPILAN